MKYLFALGVSFLVGFFVTSAISDVTRSSSIETNLCSFAITMVADGGLMFLIRDFFSSLPGKSHYTFLMAIIGGTLGWFVVTTFL